MRDCSISGCTNEKVSHNFCGMHYKRWLRHGSPYTVNSIHTFKLGYDANRYKTHGMTDSPAYISWKSMKTRCLNSRASNYSNYGKKGIKVCKRWLKFENFFEDMKARPQGTTLDRIDAAGNYEPSNCRWATFKQQARNSGRKSLIV